MTLRPVIRQLLLLVTALSLSLATAWAAPPAPPPPPRGVVTLQGAVADEEDAPRAGKVDVRMMVVYATDTHTQVDSRLGSLTRYLSHMRFTGYELLDTRSVMLGQNNSETFSIQGGREVTVTLLSKEESRVRMRVEITAGRGNKLLDTTLSVNRNGTFIVAGPKYQDGILVLPLTARY